MEDESTWVADLDASFGRRVRERRQLLGLSQIAVSVAMKLLHGFEWHQTTVAKVEAGDRPARLAEAAALAAVLHVPLTALIYGERDDAQVRDRTIAADRELAAMQHHITERRRQLMLERHGVSPKDMVSADELGPPGT